MKKVLAFCIVASLGGLAGIAGVVAAEEKADTLESVVDAYVGSWNEDDKDARRVLLESAWADDGVYTDPSGEAIGRDALVDHIEAFVTNPAMEGFSLERVSGIDAHHRVLRFDWALKDAKGTTVMKGVDYGVLAEDGRLASITGFFGPMPELAE